MAIDGIFLGYIKVELQEKLTGGRVDKIYQPQQDLLSMVIRNHNQNFRLLVSVHPQYARIHLTETRSENPLHPPDFCMLLRKHLIHGYITKIEQPEFERLLMIWIKRENLPVPVNSEKLLVIELMGKHSNVILVNPEERVIYDGLKRFREGDKSLRPIYPGAPYYLPPRQEKADPLQVNFHRFKELVEAEAGNKIYRAIMNSLRGIGPVSAREIAYRGCGSWNKKAEELSEREKGKIWKALTDILKPVQTASLAEFNGEICFDEGKITAWSPFPLTYLQGEKINFHTPGELMDYYYLYKIQRERFETRRNELLTKVEGYKAKNTAKLEKLQKKYRQYLDADKYKILGEILLANLHKIKKGMQEVTLENFYQENEPVTISLDPSSTPSKNAQHYFKKYSKAKKGLNYVANEIRKTKMEISYLESTLASIETAEEEDDLEEIRKELIEEGYLSPPGRKKKATKPRVSGPRKFLSSDGLEILVGKNNRQNDILTTKIASADDFWFHARDLPGSHVLVRNHTREETLPETTLLEAANLAAYYSKGRNSSNVPVDYTRIKHVKKPRGAKPGYVYYRDFQTIHVTPQEGEIKKLTRE